METPGLKNIIYKGIPTENVPKRVANQMLKDNMNLDWIQKYQKKENYWQSTEKAYEQWYGNRTAVYLLLTDRRCCDQWCVSYSAQMKLYVTKVIIKSKLGQVKGCECRYGYAYQKMIDTLAIMLISDNWTSFLGATFPNTNLSHC